MPFIGQNQRQGKHFFETESQLQIFTKSQENQGGFALSD